MADSSLVTYHVSNIGGGIPSLDVAKSIAMDVFSYGLWGRGYTEWDEASNCDVDKPRLPVTLEADQECPEIVCAWIPGWRKPAGEIWIEHRCPTCRQTIR